MFIHWQEEWEVTVLVVNMGVHTQWDKMSAKTTIVDFQHVIKKGIIMGQVVSDTSYSWY